MPNLRGVERALEAGADSVRLVVTSTETYNRKNVGMTVEQSLEVCSEIAKRLRDEATSLEAVIALAFRLLFS